MVRSRGKLEFLLDRSGERAVDKHLLLRGHADPTTRAARGAETHFVCPLALRQAKAVVGSDLLISAVGFWMREARETPDMSAE